MKFIHTSDWHIGRQFHNVSLLEDQRHVLEQIIQYITSEQVDALVIAGDIYDRSVPPATAVTLLDEVLHKVCHELKTPVIMISGNHDSADRLSFGARQLKEAGLFIFGDIHKVKEPIQITGKSGTAVNFFGIPYHDPEQIRQLVMESNNQADHDNTTIKNHNDAHNYLINQISDVINDQENNVLLSHCFVDGAEESESERPLSVGGADRVSYSPMLEFDYVALGHLHSPQYRGKPHIRYSGSILKYSFSEQHQKKGVTLVEVSEKSQTIKKQLKPKQTKIAKEPIIEDMFSDDLFAESSISEDTSSNADNISSNDASQPQEQASHISITSLPLRPLRDMRVLEGEMDDLLKNGENDPDAQDYLMIRLTDTHAILDAMGKLREVYPNVLHLEKPGIMAVGEKKALNREKLKRSELDMFQDFFSQVSGNPISEDQNQALKKIITQLHNAERETKA